MKSIYDNDKFHDAICHNELVYLFGTGISSALIGESCGWYKWIADGIHLLKDKALSGDLKERLDADLSADNMIKIVGEVIPILKDEGTYEKWMQESFEKNHVKDYDLARTLKKYFVLNDVIVTTNYDRLLEEATGTGSLTYEEPDKVFDMLKCKRMKSVLHIHGMYDSVRGVDNIIADRSQYDGIIDNKGAQFLQNLLGTRTVIFIGCGKTTEDGNISQLIRFSREWLKMDVTYYYLHNADMEIDGLPENIVPICYGDNFSELPDFLEEMICERLKTQIEKQRLIGRTVFSEVKNDIYGLSEYHYAREYLKFCGRKKEIGSLEAFLENDGPYLWWALTGQAGAGKSRLAFEFIHRIPKNYFGFFINPASDAEDAKQFIPFSDTLVVVDYVKGNEKHIAEIVMELFDVFHQQEYDGYKLRILFVERENLTISGTWYYSLEQAFSYYDRAAFKDAEYKPYLSSREHCFICIDDLDDDAVVELIGDICHKKGLPEDKNRDHRLRDEYSAKFEQLRFRPLFLQLYVQAWIENGKSDIDYRNYRDILKTVLDKEKEHLMMAVNGDKTCATALIRLLTRAGVAPLYEESLPEEYEKDWEAVKGFVDNNTLPGIERKEELYSIVKDASHGINGSICTKDFVIDPLYPDIIKEAFFLQYVDDMENFGSELWRNAPAEYSIFLYRCAVDFPDDKGLREYIQSQTTGYDNIPAMYARISLLHHEVITINDNPVELQKEVDEEYAYWCSVPTDGTNADELRKVRLEGLHDSLLMYVGWSNVKSVIDATKELADTPDTPSLRERKCRYLLEMVKYLTNGGLVSVNTSEYTIDLLNKLLDEMDKESELYHYMKLSVDSYHIQNCIIAIKPNRKSASGYSQKDWDAAKEMLSDLKSACNLSSEQDAEIYAYTVYRCTLLAREKLAGGNICYFCDEIQDYAVDCAQSNGKLAFNDQIHYYYLHAKLVDVDSVCMASTLALGQSDYASSVIDGFIDEIESNEMIRDFSGLLVGAWAIKVGCDESITDAKVISYIEKAKGYLADYPDNSLLAEKYFDLISSALEFQFKRPANKSEIEFGYSLALRFPLEKRVLEGFFELLKKSSEYRNWRSYLNNKQICTGLVQNRLEKYLTETIPASLGPMYPNPIAVKENAFVQSMMPEPTATYVRNHKKIGANDPCPCGSGNKFKKCCRGKGFFD